MRENTEKNKQKKFSGKRAAALIVFVVLLLVLLLFPLPYIYKSPGRLIPASAVVEVEGGRRTGPGEIYITTVITEQANLILYLNGWFNPDSRLIPFQQYYGKKGTKARAASGPDPFEVQKEESIYRAKLFAMQKMGYDVNLHFAGAQVTAYLPGSKARRLLKPGDVIIRVDDMEVKH